VRINFPSSYNGRERKIAYVEFGDEETMKAGLEKHEEVCLVLSCHSPYCSNPMTVFYPQELNGGKPEVKRSDRDHPREHHNYRGRGRGGPRGAFVRRGFASAGLVRDGGAPKTNGDT
jgi:hypothetical protein